MPNAISIDLDDPLRNCTGGPGPAHPHQAKKSKLDDFLLSHVVPPSHVLSDG